MPCVKLPRLGTLNPPALTPPTPAEIDVPVPNNLPNTLGCADVVPAPKFMGAVASVYSGLIPARSVI